MGELFYVLLSTKIIASFATSLSSNTMSFTYQEPNVKHEQKIHTSIKDDEAPELDKDNNNLVRRII